MQKAYVHMFDQTAWRILECLKIELSKLQNQTFSIDNISFKHAVQTGFAPMKIYPYFPLDIYNTLNSINVTITTGRQIPHMIYLEVCLRFHLNSQECRKLIDIVITDFYGNSNSVWVAPLFLSTAQSVSQHSPTYHIVVARYKEDLSWTEYIDRRQIFVYDKSGEVSKHSILRRNIGREVESFLFHVIQHYHNLPEYLVFLQGNPFDHMFPIITPQNFQSELSYLLSTLPKHSLSLYADFCVEEIEAFKTLKFEEYFKLLFDSAVPDEITYACGTQYIVPRDVILSKPKQYYAHIHSLLLHGKQFTLKEAHDEEYAFDRRAINGWALERLWSYLWSDIPPSPAFCRKRYLVTGGAGFIGGHVTHKLAELGYTVIVLDNLSTGSIKNLPVHENVHFIEGNILNADDLYMAGIVDGIFHLAAMSKVLPSMKDPSMIDYCTEQNVKGTISVLTYAAEHVPPCKVVYSASSTVDGSNKIPHHEELPPDLHTPYALSKYVGEEYCKLYSRLYNVPTVRLRYFMVFGPNEPNEGAYAVVTGVFLKRMKQGIHLLIHGDGLQTRDFVHVFDVANANILAMDNSQLRDETINVCTGEMISIKEIASFISNDTVHINARSFDMRSTLCDTNKMESLLKIKPALRIKDYIYESVVVAADGNIN